MFVVNNRVWVKPEFAAMFEQRFANRAGQIDKQPGFVRMQILKPATDAAPYVVATAWESKEAFDGWVGSDDFKLAHQNPMPKDAFRDDKEGGIEMFDVVISTG